MTKAYPKLEKAAKERLDVNLHLQQLKRPQASFTVRYKQPAKLDKATSATLEMEGYSMKPGRVVASAQSGGKPAGEITVIEVMAWNSLAVTVERFTVRMERLESECVPRLLLTSSMWVAQPWEGVGEWGHRWSGQFHGNAWPPGMWLPPELATTGKLAALGMRASHIPEGKVESLYNFSSVEHSSMKKLLQNSMQLQWVFVS